MPSTEEEVEQEGGGGDEERFHGTLSKRSAGHRMRTTAITQFQRYVQKKESEAFNTANVPWHAMSKRPMFNGESTPSDNHQSNSLTTSIFVPQCIRAPAFVFQQSQFSHSMLASMQRAAVKELQGTVRRKPLCLEQHLEFTSPRASELLKMFVDVTANPTEGARSQVVYIIVLAYIKI